jgi:hypothetical protein
VQGQAAAVVQRHGSSMPQQVLQLRSTAVCKRMQDSAENYMMDCLLAKSGGLTCAQAAAVVLVAATRLCGLQECWAVQLVLHGCLRQGVYLAAERSRCYMATQQQ